MFIENIPKCVVTIDNNLPCSNRQEVEHTRLYVKAIESAVKTFLADGLNNNKIDAIKFVRNSIFVIDPDKHTLRPCGLKFAKDFVEDIINSGHYYR